MRFLVNWCASRSHNLIKNKLYDLYMLKTLFRIKVFCHFSNRFPTLLFFIITRS